MTPATPNRASPNRAAHNLAGPELAAGFAEPVRDSQAVFRALLDAMAHPGRVVAVPACPLPQGAARPAALSVLLALADGETPVWLDPAAHSDVLADYLRFHCGCAITPDPDLAGFALIAAPAAMPPLDTFCPGTAEYPDRSTTVIVQVDRLAGGEGVRLTGPGIETEARLNAEPLPDAFWRWAAANRERFPLGVDLVLAAHDRLAALPRSVTVEG